jgi:ATP-dependent DNA helicase RecQ
MSTTKRQSSAKPTKSKATPKPARTRVAKPKVQAKATAPRKRKADDETKVVRSNSPSKPARQRAVPTPAAQVEPAIVAPVRGAAYSLDREPAKGSEHLPRDIAALLSIGQEVLGIKGFRPGQAEAYEHLLKGRDLLAVMPTGSGKSLLYQLPSLVSDGVTVVVSPLIALIKDQIDKMVAKGVTAVRIDSTLTVKQRREVNALVQSPGGKLLLTTPERMADPEFRTFLRTAAGNVGVSRFVVDEAHCVSQWGHDFRPAYLSLRKAIDEVGRPPILATTATAPPHVREDILHQLGIESAEIVTTTFDRPNLHYEVIVFHDEDEKMRTLVTLLKKLPRPGIVYCATVKKVEELHEALSRWGIPVARYHGRLNKKERDTEQQRFMDSKDIVMVATNAFGLGIDKQDIRNVLHYHVPGSLEAYAQEAGRGGRDGKPARCVLLFSPDDVAIQEYFLQGSYPTRRQVRLVFEALEAFGNQRADIGEDTLPTIANLALSAGVGSQRTRTVLNLLKEEKFIVEKDGGQYFVSDPPPAPELISERARQYEGRRIADRRRLDALLEYVKSPSCRNVAILEYLGEPDSPKCGRCDNCLRSREAVLAAATEATRIGSTVIRKYDEDGIEIPKPKREVRARTIRIDAPAAPPVVVATSPAVMRRSSAPVAAPAPSPTPSVVSRRASGSIATPVVSKQAGDDADRAHDKLGSAVASNPVQAHKAGQAAKNLNQENDADEDDDDLDDDDLDDDDDDDLDDDDDDDLDDDDDDDEDDDLDDDDDDDDDDDEDDYELIEKTAAELAEEGIEGSGEVTVLARKRVPKVAKQRGPRGELTTTKDLESAAEARRRRRRRRRKRRAMLPPKSAFTTPVLSTGGNSNGRRSGGPVVEYVRSPIRIGSSPVASANPNDAGVMRRTKKKRRGGGWERRPEGSEDKGWITRPPKDQVVPNVDAQDDGARRRRRRRRRREGAGSGVDLPPIITSAGAASGLVAPPVVERIERVERVMNENGEPDEPVILGPDGQPMRKRRRRRRRGRGGRVRERWTGADGEASPPSADGGAADATASSGGNDSAES